MWFLFTKEEEHKDASLLGPDFANGEIYEQRCLALSTIAVRIYPQWCCE